ncbi:MAG: hypothetical protein EP343_08855 [Deltaproteobacteria bacterium]|nr:MAG: hypothetical protein EP343_08855 [Deltaproteobacteria bacterium]
MRFSPTLRLYFGSLLLVLASFLWNATQLEAAKPQPQTAKQQTTDSSQGCLNGCPKGQFCFHNARCLPHFKMCLYDEHCAKGNTCVDVGNQHNYCLPRCSPKRSHESKAQGKAECWGGFGRCFQVSDEDPNDGACYPPAYSSQTLGKACGKEGAFDKASYHFCTKDTICYGQRGKQTCRIKCDPRKSATPNKVSPNPQCDNGKSNCVPLGDNDGVCFRVLLAKGAVKPMNPEQKAAQPDGLVANVVGWVKAEFKSQFLDSESGIFWLYILAHVLFGALYFLLYHNPGGRFSIRQALAAVFPAKIYKSRQFFNDGVITILNQSYPIALFLSLEVYSNTVGVFVKHAMFSTLGPPGFMITGTWAAIGFTIVMLLMSDLGAFVAHWCQHRIAFLWEFHKVHHSATTLSPLTNNRSHPIDLLLIGNVTGLLIGIAVGVAGYLSKSTLDDTTITWINATIVAAPLILENFQHSHIPISFGWLNNVIMSPVMHQIHHSKAPEHLDKNLAQIFSFWDRMAGTMALPKKGEKLEFGIDDDKNDDYEKLWVIYFIPFVRAFQLLYGGLTKRFRKQHPPPSSPQEP